MIAPFFYEDVMPFRPKLVEALLLRLNFLMAELLYWPIYKVDPQAAVDRIMVYDTPQGTQGAIAEYSSHTGMMNPEYPFSLYKPGITIPREEGNTQVAALGLEYAYCPELGMYIQAYPVEMEVIFIHLYNNAPDSRVALNIIAEDAASLSRLYVPLRIGSIDAVVAADYDVEVSEGDFYGKTDLYDDAGRVWDLNEVVTLKFYDYALRPTDEQEVQEIIVNAGDLQSVLTIFNVEVSETFPANDESNVQLNTPITVKFNSDVIPSSVRYRISGDVVSTSKVEGDVLTIMPAVGLQPNTKYEVDVLAGAKNSQGAIMPENYKLIFFT